MKKFGIYSQRYQRLIVRLIAARHKAGLSQAEIATKLGVSQPDVSKIEHGQRRIDLLETLDWCTATGYDCSTLLAELEAENA